MSAVWGIELPRLIASDRECTHAEGKGSWNGEMYVQQQIRTLVRQVFFSNAPRPAKQVVFSPVGIEISLAGICKRVGEALAQRAAGDVAIIGERGDLFPAWRDNDSGPEADRTELRWIATRVQRNIWLLPPATSGGKTSVQPYLEAIRKEFEYSILVAPAIGESDDAMAMAEFADGIVLVLSAGRTRRAMTRQIKGEIDQAGVRLLGAVLTDREFPIPEKLYRALRSV